MEAKEWCEDELSSLTSESDLVSDFKITGLNQIDNYVEERLEYAQDEKPELTHVMKDDHNSSVPVIIK